MEKKKDMVNIYLINIAELKEEQQFNDLFQQLNHERREKISRMKHMVDKKRSLGAGLLIKTGFEEMGIAYKSIHFEKLSKGKTYAVNYPEIHYNVSHSGHYAIAAFGNQPIGIDIERIREDDSFEERREKIVLRTYSTQEKAWYKQKDETDKAFAFAEIWTKKESYLKATGEGITVELDTINTFENGNYVTIETDCKDMVATYCTLEKKEPNYQIKQVNVKDFLL